MGATFDLGVNGETQIPENYPKPKTPDPKQDAQHAFKGAASGQFRFDAAANRWRGVAVDSTIGSQN